MGLTTQNFCTKDGYKTENIAQIMSQAEDFFYGKLDLEEFARYLQKSYKLTPQEVQDNSDLLYSQLISKAFECIHSLSAQDLVDLVATDVEFNALIIEQTLVQSLLDQIKVVWPANPLINNNWQPSMIGLTLQDGIVSISGLQIYGLEEDRYLYIRSSEETKLINWYIPQFEQCYCEEESSNPFFDVQEDDWFYKYVMDLYTNNLVEGFTNNTFRPFDNTTRAQLIVILDRLTNLGVTSNIHFLDALLAEQSFLDIQFDDWYAGTVGWGIKSEIIKGFDDGTFRPNLEITLEEVAVILYRFAKEPTSSGDGVSIFDVQEEVKDALDWAVNVGIIGDEMLNSKSFVKRAEACEMVSRYMSLYE
ncbi:MAG: hypothetical protein ATN36_04635 [Epulopiscium sp. Nele67-Bin005]|nr:MAG: hypothetical protein ATN36_04635 [Epulopiscium sp. Nele67-Bin005]